ncbi:MAG: hypothetical protein ABH845_06855 [Candidatus Omnitrophota bacterium]
MQVRFFLVMLFLGSGLSLEAADFVYKKSGRDPFWPLVTKEGKLIQDFGTISLENIFLEGIIWDPYSDSIAMINGMIFRKGEYVGDFEILKIEEDRVTLRDGNEERYLTLEEKL